MTLDEARLLIAPTILIAQEMRQLREQHGVEIYEDNLPNPAQFGSQFADPLADL